MKKPLVFVAAACVGALALHADFTYSDWFRAIGDGVTTTNNLMSVNGSWAAFSGDVSWNSGLVFDLEDNQSLTFTATQGTEPDTNTVTKVVVNGVFSPAFCLELPSQSDMNARNAQVGFVVAFDGSATNFYAWTGGESWFKISNQDAPPDVENAMTLEATFAYTNSSTSYVSFAIRRNSSETSVAYVLTNDSQASTFPITSTAANSRRLAGFSCYGSGLLASADGSVGLSVATLSDGVKYGSIADAVAAAGTSATTVTVVRATSENAAIPSGSNITISDPGEKATGTITVHSGTTVKVDTTVAQFDPATNGVYTIPLKTSGGTVVVNLPTDVAQYKEVASNVVTASGIDVAIHTRSDIVTATAPDGTKALSKNETKLREFLNTYANAEYVASNATSATLATALQASGGNGIPLWESYVLGIAPTDSIAPVTAPAGDTDANNITLAIPAIDPANYSGDYSVLYQVVGTSGSVAETNSPHAVKVPLTTGTYTIKATLTPQ